MKPIVIEPKTTATAAVIWLHGLGANGHDFENIIPDLKLPENSGIRFIFPNAEMIPITINGGMVMPGWYDIRNMGDMSNDVDIVGIEKSIKQITLYIDQQIQSGIDSNKIILAGFSQGGVIAINAALEYPQPLASIIALSTYLPAWDHFENKVNPANQKLPTFLAHGTFDPVVPFQASHILQEALIANGNSVDFHSYPMQHQVCYEEIEKISEWIKKYLIN